MNEADKRRLDLIAKEGSKAGLRGKINAKCIECVYDPLGGDGSWRQQVQNCLGTDCPLYPVRPLSRA